MQPASTPLESTGPPHFLARPRMSGARAHAGARLYWTGVFFLFPPLILRGNAPGEGVLSADGEVCLPAEFLHQPCARGLGPKARKLWVAATPSNDNLDSVPHCHSVVPNQTVI